MMTRTPLEVQIMTYRERVLTFQQISMAAGVQNCLVSEC